MSISSLPVVKILFAEASQCAFQPCLQPLVLRERGLATVNVQIAHIRSAKRNGPRFEVAYPVEQINQPENLLLLCGIHHHPVDQNHSAYKTAELLEWKAEQVRQGSIGPAPSDAQLATLVTRLDEIAEHLLRLTSVQLDAVLCEAQEVASGELLRVPAGTLGRITIDGMIGTASFAGVQIVNVGQVGSTVDAIGFHFDVGGSVPVTYMFGQPTVGPLLPCRLHGHSDSAWMLHRDVIAAAVTKLATAESMMPLRLRPWGRTADGTTVTGGWDSVLALPIWRPGTTEADVEALARTAARQRHR